MKRFTDKGFTLLEVTVALAMVAVSLAAVLGSQSRGVSLAAEARFSTTASLLAQSVLARYETMESRSMISDSGGFDDDFPGYIWKAEVERVFIDEPPGAAGLLRRVEVTVAREEIKGFEYTLRRYLYVRK
jgi:general secretion pathway protein I